MRIFKKVNMIQKLLFLLVFVSFFISCQNKEEVRIPLNHTKEKKTSNPDKKANWTPEQAANHQKILAKLAVSSKKFKNNKNSKLAQNTTYANGALIGNWKNRGPKNMPGAFKFAEMLDGTDIIYGVSFNHYPTEYNSKAYIFKGTVYNPVTGTGGDDFQLLTANWPNRYQNLFAFKIGQTTRLVAHIENGPIYYSDNEGTSWVQATGLPSTIKSATINRQDNNVIYVTDNTSVYVSTNFGVSFNVLKNFGTPGSSFLYTPRYAVQSGAASVYLARDGSFYKLNSAKTDFNLKGSYIFGHGEENFSVSGDDRVLYVTEWGRYWVSTDDGATWTQKNPKGTYYGTETAKMAAGKFFAVHPQNPNISLGGYTNPVISLDALNTTKVNSAGWGNYQSGTNLPTQDYYNRIRFNYHPDFQASHFFYNSSGTLFSVRCTDGGLFVSYKEWTNFPVEGVSFDNTNYANAHYINLNVLNTTNALIYRENLFTGGNNSNHINFSTQDQGSQSIITGTSGDVLDFYQNIGGDGPPFDSYDGQNLWKWERQGDKVYSPVKMYTNLGGFRSVSDMNSLFNSSATVTFARDTDMGWVQTYIDHNEPDKRIWMLSKKLDRATVSGSSLVGYTVDKGTNQVAALAQAWGNNDKLYMLQDGKVFRSNDRGTTFDAGIVTPFLMTGGGWGNGDIGSGVVLPNNDNWILFCGPSSSATGSILSKDGGNTWVDVTGNFPAGSDAQTGGMIVSPDSKYIFAGTDIGPYFFNIAEEKWYSIAEGIGFFNAMDVDYITSENIVRFGTWGSGVLDFKIDLNALGIAENEITDNGNIADIVIYPNPAKNFVNLKLNSFNKSEIEIQIFNLEGKKVLDKKHVFQTNLKSVSLDISSIESGIYLVNILDDTAKLVAAEKLIVQ